MLAWGQKNGHVWKIVPNSHGFHIGDPRRAGVIGSQDERLAGWGVKSNVLKLIPDCLVHAIRITSAGGKQVNHKQVNSLANQAYGLIDKFAKVGPACLVAR